MTARIREFLKRRKDEGPCLVVDLDVVRENYLAFAKSLPDSKVFYAVKANPAPEILKLLTALGCCFDVASVNETQAVLEAGASPEERSDPGRSTALTQDEIDWLGKVLDSECMPDDAMGVEEIDGYVCALVMDANRDWARGMASAILGPAQKASVFESEGQAKRAARLVARMWNTIISRLDAGNAHRPILWGSEAPKAQRWAKGFIAGMQAARSKWWKPLQDEDVHMFLDPILGLALDEGEEEEGLLATPDTREGGMDRVAANKHSRALRNHVASP